METYAERAIEIIDELHTERLDYYSEYIPLIDAAQALESYEATGVSPEQIEEMSKRLCRYEQAEEEGRLVVLPCKVGTHLFVARQDTNTVYEAEMVGFWAREFGEAMRLYIFDDNRFTTTPVENYGQTVFLTHEEAAAALKEREKE